MEFLTVGAGGDLTLLPAFGTLFFLLSCLTEAWCKNMGLVLLSLDVLGWRPWKACSFQGRGGGSRGRGEVVGGETGGVGRGNCNPDEIYMKEELTERKEMHVRLPHLCSKPSWASCFLFPHSVPSSAMWAWRALGLLPVPAMFSSYIHTESFPVSPLCSYATCSVRSCPVILFKPLSNPQSSVYFLACSIFLHDMAWNIFIYLFLFILSNINSIRSEGFACFAY